MKKILSTLIVVAAAFSVVASASAQAAGLQGGTPKAGIAQAKRQQNLLTILNKLNLTGDQKSKIKAQIAKAASEVKAVRADVKAGKITKEDAKTKSKEIRKANQAAIRAILTKDQVKQFTQLMKEARAKNKAAAGAGAGKPGGN